LKFTEFGLDERIIEATEIMGYDTPTPVQEQAIPAILSGKDLIASAQTGTGKTAIQGGIFITSHSQAYKLRVY